MQRATVILVIAVSMVFYGCGKPGMVDTREEDVVSWESLLLDASKLKLLGIGCSRLFSSAAGGGDAVLTGRSPKTYGDLDHGSFLDVKDVPGGVEATLAEMDGAGSITWVQSANPMGELVLQVDGREFTMPFKAFLEGKWLPVRYPFAAQTADGFNLHFPIIHKEHCRVAVRAKSRAELGAMFYQVAWNAMEPGSRIKSFDWNEIRGAKVELKQLAHAFVHPPEWRLETVFKNPLADGAFVDALSVSGSGVIQCLEISARSKKQLAGLSVEMFWDGAVVPSISCPLHMLCGTSKQFEGVESLPATVKGATAMLRWPMSFSNGARIRLENTSGGETELHVSVAIDRGHPSAYRLRGNFTRHWDLQTDEANVLKLAEVSGQGNLVGCILQVENRSDGWWGEGDPLIWLDSDDRPAWRGTGTEDYFGFSWCSMSEFQHPLRGQTRASPSFAAMYRYHILDPLPFNEWARFAFEAHGTGSGSMDYSALVLWYSVRRESFNALWPHGSKSVAESF
ncbi:MAG: glycoside hydrolase family 172 protein [Verrucomicrobiota bacterium]